MDTLNSKNQEMNQPPLCSFVDFGFDYYCIGIHNVLENG